MKFHHLVPQHTQETLENYLSHGWEPGGFCEAMLAMDMERALVVADQANAASFCYIGRWILEHAPEGSWGNYENVKAWCANVNERRTKWATWNNLSTTPKQEKDFEF
jgi:hypothetical protein